MRQEVRWERMFPDELEAAFTACPVVYFAYGLCEPHGPHCALGLDALKAHAIACAAARAHGGIVAPPDYWHCHELGIYHFDQIASWGAAEVAWMDSNLKGFKGRVTRDKWVAQAKLIGEVGMEEFLRRAKTNDY